MVEASERALRQAAVHRLAQLDTAGALGTEHVVLTAQALDVSERTVWRWVAARRASTPETERDRFRTDDALRTRLAYWRGNAAALHRELKAAENNRGPTAPTLRTIQRAIERDLPPGDHPAHAELGCHPGRAAGRDPAR